MKPPTRDTILSTIDNQRVFGMVYKAGGEFRVLVRSGAAAEEKGKYSGVVAWAEKLKSPRKYPTGFSYALRVKPTQPLKSQGTKSDV